MACDDFCKNIFKVIIFIIIGCSIFVILQSILVPKRYSYSSMYDSGKLTNYYNEKKNEIDILIEGTSHSAGGIFPMELYEGYGIKSYNLSTGTQSIEVSYYMACEAFKTQKPKVLILDIGNLYILDAKEFHWRIVLDEMHFGKNKFLFSNDYCKQFLGGDNASLEIMFPLLYYHANWKSLSQQDFRDHLCNRNSYDKGGVMTSTIAQTWLTVDQMNEMTETLIQDHEQISYIYNGEEFIESRNESSLYSADIPDKNLGWFKKIQELCEENGVELLAIKVPSINSPQSYRSAWTREKYNKVKNVCEELGIAYYDLMYDTDVELDWGKDTWDGGLHLNLNGARKISANIGNYLKLHYNLFNEQSNQWDKGLALYQGVRSIALLELEQDFVTYMNMLIDEYNDKMIFIAASDDMSNGLNEADINTLQSLGLKMDYSQAFDNSYIAVIENGQVQYEALSNRPLSYGGVIGLFEKRFDIYSSGWNTNSQASIRVNGIDYAVNGRGLNIVVYDVERDLVLDSVCFDTFAEYHTAARNNGMINELRQEVERYTLEVAGR